MTNEEDSQSNIKNLGENNLFNNEIEIDQTELTDILDINSDPNSQISSANSLNIIVNTSENQSIEIQDFEKSIHKEPKISEFNCGTGYFLNPIEQETIESIEYNSNTKNKEENKYNYSTILVANQSNVTNIGQLPYDIVLLIFTFIPNKYIRTIGCVSRFYFQVSKDNVLWKDIYEEMCFFNLNKKYVENAISEGYFDKFLEKQDLSRFEHEHIAKYMICSKLEYDSLNYGNKIAKKDNIASKLQKFFRILCLFFAPTLFWLMIFACTITLSILSDKWVTSTLGKWLCTIPFFGLAIVYIGISCFIIFDPTWMIMRNKYKRKKFTTSNYIHAFETDSVDKDVVGCIYYLVFGNSWIILLFFGIFGYLGMSINQTYITYWLIPLYLSTLLNFVIPLALLLLRYFCLKENYLRLRTSIVLYILNALINLFVFIQVLLIGLKIDWITNAPISLILLPLWLLFCTLIIVVLFSCCNLPVLCFIRYEIGCCGYALCCFQSSIIFILCPLIFSAVMLTIHFDTTTKLYSIIAFIPTWSLLLILCCLTSCCSMISYKSKWN